MTRFLRFEIGGASALLWAFLFLGPYLNVAELLSIDAVKFLSFVFGSAVLSIPLGNYIHQVTDTLFNPFRKWRLFFFRRAAVTDIQELLRTEKAGRDHTFQAVLVFCKAISREEKLSSVDPKKEIITKFDAAVLREEISNRYSYYYARIENGVIAPVLGGAFAAFAYRLFCTTSYVLSEPKFSVWW